MSPTKRRSRIKRLSEEEYAQLQPWADRWIAVGRHTGDADRPRFEAAVRECYRYAQLAPPTRIMWAPSPLAAVTPGFVPALGDAAVYWTVHGAVHGVLYGPLQEAAYEAADVVHDALYGTVQGAVHGPAHEAIHLGVCEAGVGVKRWQYYFPGQFSTGWLWGVASLSFFRDVCDLSLPGDLWDRARAYEATAESACWWWPHRHVVVVSEHPTQIHTELRDPSVSRGHRSHRLHCATGPAVAFRDGWHLWYWHGVRVTEQIIIRPHTLTAEQVIREPNAEVRRTMIERMGFDRFLSCAQAVALDSDEGGRRTLYRLDLDDDEPLQAVKVQCPSTGQIYFLRVPPTITTCQGAVAWTFGYERVQEYAPQIET